MQIAIDTIKHLKAGTAVLVWAILLSVLALLAGLNPLSALIASNGLTSSITEEASQWLANRARRRLGLAPERDVSVKDALAGAAPCLLAAAALEIALRAGALVLLW